MMARRTGRRIRMSRGDRVFSVLNGLVLTFLVFLVIYPVWYALVASFSDPQEVALGNLYILPKGFSTLAYSKVFRYERIWTGYRNTILYTIAGTCIDTAMSVLCAYPLSRVDFVGRKLFMKLFVFTMYFSGGMIPTFLLVRSLHLYDTMWALILPGCISMTHVIIIRSFFMNSIPGELQDAAQIDGCNNWRLFVRIVLPLSMPVLAVIILYNTVGHWNSYFSAMIYLSTSSKYPLQLILRDILISSNTSTLMENADTAEDMMTQIMIADSIKYSVMVVSSLPMIILYPFLQKYFEKGIMMGAVKG